MIIREAGGVVTTPDGAEAEVTAYRYASLPYYEEDSAGGQLTGRLRERQEPFLVGLQPGRRGENRIAGIVPTCATFLRYEKELGSIEPAAVAALDAVVLADRAVVRDLIDRTIRAIDEAPG